MARTIVATDNAPSAIGPYSQAVVMNGFVFVSGQIALDPATGALVDGGVVEQTEQVLANLYAVLAAAGASFASVVKTTIYLTDLGDFQVVNQLYGKCFEKEPPARATVQVSALPKGAVVEIDAIAAVVGQAPPGGAAAGR
ncbi:MAG: RidA family protein [Polyangiaceae bacterium]